MIDKELLFAEPITSVMVHHRNAPWYLLKGYRIPESRHYPGRPSTGFALEVKTEDIYPGSLQRVDVLCEKCGEVYNLRWREYLAKQSNTCIKCRSHPDNCHSHEYWLKRLIGDAELPACDISGETDKRFLVLHHKMARSNGGANEETNYVVLSANYHEAFHRSIGTKSRATPEDYEAFKVAELKETK
jgi:hypothetical protein